VPAAAGDSVLLSVLSVDGSGSVVSCSGLLAFDQDALEAGTQYINVTGSGSAGNQTAAASSQLVAVVPLNLPSLLVDVVGSNCSLPGAAGGAVSCAVEVQNSGNVRLQAGSVTGSGSASSSGCAFGVLAPGGKFSCAVQQPVSQADFDAADDDAAYTVSIGVSSTATPMGSNTTNISAEDMQPLLLSPAVRHGVRIDETTANPTIVIDAGASAAIWWCCFSCCQGAFSSSLYMLLRDDLAACLGKNNACKLKH
jgi:hypothetical protein